MLIKTLLVQHVCCTTDFNPQLQNAYCKGMLISRLLLHHPVLKVRDHSLVHSINMLVVKACCPALCGSSMLFNIVWIQHAMQY